MRIKYTDVEFLPSLGILKDAERAGRVCYKSEDKSTETSAINFVKMIIDKNHFSVIEHGSVYLESDKELEDFKELPWCHIEHNKNKFKYYTNLRYVQETDPDLASAIIEGNPLPSGIVFFEPELDNPYRRWSFRIITNFKISEQYVRHRAMSHCKESSRWCNYAKDRFGNETTIIIPIEYKEYFKGAEGHIESIDDKWYFTPAEDTPLEIITSLDINYSKDKDGRYILDLFSWNPICARRLTRAAQAEQDYMNVINEGGKAEDARDYLTLFTKTEQIMTGFAKDWEDLVAKRTVPAAQRDAQFIANRIRRLLIEKVHPQLFSRSFDDFDIKINYFREALDIN